MWTVRRTCQNYWSGKKLLLHFFFCRFLGQQNVQQDRNHGGGNNAGAAENQLDNLIHPVIVQTVNRMMAADFVSNKDALNAALQDGLTSIYQNLGEVLAEGIAEGVTVRGGDTLGCIGESAFLIVASISSSGS